MSFKSTEDVEMRLPVADTGRLVILASLEGVEGVELDLLAAVTDELESSSDTSLSSKPF